MKLFEYFSYFVPNCVKVSVSELLMFVLSPCHLSGHGNRQAQEVLEDLDLLCLPAKITQTI